MKKIRHKAIVLTKEQFEAGRSNAYAYFNFGCENKMRLTGVSEGNGSDDNGK